MGIFIGLHINYTDMLPSIEKHERSIELLRAIYKMKRRKESLEGSTKLWEEDFPELVKYLKSQLVIKNMAIDRLINLYEKLWKQ